MSQVLAISSETEITGTPEQSQSRSSNVDFDALLEKEKQKLSFPFPFSMLQSLFSIPFTFIYGGDASVKKVDVKPQLNNDEHSPRPVIHQASKKQDIEKNEAKSSLNPNSPVERQKTNNIQFTGNVINKLFVGELELTPEFYNILLTAKNKVASLRGVDVDDLISQIQDKIKLLKDNGKVEMSLQLKPENLGTILMSVTSNKGVISINLYADNVAREALEESIQELEKSLKRVNLNIGSLNVFSDEKRKNNRGELAELLYNNSGGINGNRSN